MCAKLLQLCPAFCDPMDHSPPGTSVHGILDTGMGCHTLLSGVLLNPGIKPVPLMPTCNGRRVLYF